MNIEFDFDVNDVVYFYNKVNKTCHKGPIHEVQISRFIDDSVGIKQKIRVTFSLNPEGSEIADGYLIDFGYVSAESDAVIITRTKEELREKVINEYKEFNPLEGILSDLSKLD